MSELGEMSLPPIPNKPVKTSALSRTKHFASTSRSNNYSQKHAGESGSENWTKRRDHHNVPDVVENRPDREYRLGYWEKQRSDKVHKELEIQEGIDELNNPFKIENKFPRPYLKNQTRFSRNGQGEKKSLGVGLNNRIPLWGSSLRRAQKEAAFEQRIKRFGQNKLGR